MITLLRVDHRLIHGQVVLSWLTQYDSNAILIANDDLPSDDLRKQTLRLAKPADAKLVIKTVDDAIAAIAEGRTDAYRLFILTENVADACRIAEACADVDHINLGGTRPSADATRVTSTVALTAADRARLELIAARGVHVEARAVPSDRETVIGATR
ncbi:PTS sugar transporter subunit IIB [Microbacterium sp. W4I20]|uniref:PTS sugar transporter subunit IIB n=1 Tax=Microbacterium sp. W4I20 TaxID=3042262 RepID=UPI00277DBB16|nr:PTS sugar transporter subunit IIB [Microbacterium sp. W4I20]MDQ0727931.1 fructoselysine and glucoselysine-specific PTS system IIB component [Microbacterium sp. W4I20]